MKRSIKGLRVRKRGRMEDKLSGCPGKRRRTLKSGPRASVCPFIRWPDGTTTHTHSSGPIPFSQGVAKRFMSSEMGLLRHGSLIYVPRCYPPFCFACFIFGWQSTAPVFEAGRGPGVGFNLLRGTVVPLCFFWVTVRKMGDGAYGQVWCYSGVRQDALGHVLSEKVDMKKKMS